MINLSIDNSVCQISGLSSTQMKELRELMSYTVDPQVSFFGGGHRSPKRYLLDARGVFPSGLVPIVQGYFSQSKLPNYSVTQIDRRKRPLPQEGLFALRQGPTPYPQQKAAVEACRTSGRGVVCMPTGFGKSITMALLIARLQLRTLIIVPNVELKLQLSATLRECFGNLNNITIKNIQDPSLAKETNYDCLIIDEAHHVAARTYRTLNKKAWTSIYHRFFFTATPFRSRDEEQMLYESIAGQVIYRVTYQEALAAGAIVPVEAYYVDIPTQECDANTWAAVYSQLVVRNEVRNTLISKLLIRLHRAEVPTLCLVKEIAHGNILSNDSAFPFANGQDGESNHLISLFNAQEGPTAVLIGTTGVVGEGVDTKPCEYVIIAGLGKSKNAFMQQVGRAVRRYPGKESAKVIIFRDRSHRFTVRHFNAQVKILMDEYGVRPVKLDL